MDRSDCFENQLFTTMFLSGGINKIPFENSIGFFKKNGSQSIPVNSTPIF